MAFQMNKRQIQTKRKSVPSRIKQNKKLHSTAIVSVFQFKLNFMK